MSLAEDFATFEPAAAVQKSYDSALSNPFQGQQLAPWTALRQSVAVALQVQAVGLDSRAVRELAETGTYSNAYYDAVVVLWLCSIPDAEVARWVAKGEPAAAIQAAFAWADAKGIKYGSAGHWEGIALVKKIVEEVAGSFFETAGAMAADGAKKKSYRPAWQLQIGIPAAQATGHSLEYVLTKMPLAHAIQAQAMYYQLREYPVDVRHLSHAEERCERLEEERILNG